MTDKPGCSLWIMTSRTDVGFLKNTLPHIVKICNYPFTEKVIAIDAAKPSGEKLLRPHLASLGQIRDICKAFLDNGIVDRIVDIDYSEQYRRKIYKKHFGLPHIKATHNFKGYPILGSMFCIEECATDYIVHFDSDMLIWQKEGYDWISEGIKNIESDPALIWARAQAGPISDNADKIGRLNCFASRVYLLDRRKLEKILPLKLLWAAPGLQGRLKRKLPDFVLDIIHYITGNGKLDSWEKIMSRALKHKNRFGEWLNHDNNCWTLHPCDHGNRFLEILPELIQRVEKGDYPPEQLGKYDVELEAWRKYLGVK